MKDKIHQVAYQVAYQVASPVMNTWPMTVNLDWWNPLKTLYCRQHGLYPRTEIIRRDKKRRVNTVLLSAVGKSWVRKSAMAYRDQHPGFCRVVEIEHHMSFGFWPNRHLIDIMSEVDDQYVSWGPVAAHFWQQNIRASGNSKPFVSWVDARPLLTPYLRDNWRGPVGHVAVIGFPAMPGTNWPDHLPCHDAVRQLDLEMRIMMDLRAWGYRVTYKARPSTAHNLDRTFHHMMSTLDIEIDRRPWEKTWRRYDAYVFGGSQHSGVLTLAIHTARPIVLIDMEREWSQGAREYVGRRCLMVPAECRDRIEYDDKRLKEVLLWNR